MTSMTPTLATTVSPWAVAAALATIYLVWGSTYLGMRVAVESIPPLTMAGTRFLAAGLILYAVARSLGADAPSRCHWRNTAILGGVLLTIGNGTLCWAEQTVPSGLAALLAATTPLWLTAIETFRPGGRWPSRLTTLGVVLGLLAVVGLILAGDKQLGHRIDWPALGVLGAAMAFAVGSLLSRSLLVPSSTLLSAGMQMALAGAMLLASGAARGEWTDRDWQDLTQRSLYAWFYLFVAGSLLAFPVFAWLVRAGDPVLVSTYAYINPVVAVMLGCWLAEESLTPAMVLAGAGVVLSVGLIVTGSAQHQLSHSSQQGDS